MSCRGLTSSSSSAGVHAAHHCQKAVGYRTSGTGWAGLSSPRDGLHLSCCTQQRWVASGRLRAPGHRHDGSRHQVAVCTWGGVRRIIVVGCTQQLWRGLIIARSDSSTPGARGCCRPAYVGGATCAVWTV